MLYKIITKDRKSILSSGKYKITYPSKGKVVRAIPGTIGLMCFKTFNNAINFREKALIGVRTYVLIEVMPLAPIIKRKDFKITTWLSELDFDEFYRLNQKCAPSHYLYGDTPPIGSVVCAELKIGDDYYIK